MAAALARTTLLSSVFISATVCRTVASNVASSSASTPALACPRATRPTRPKKSDRNGIVYYSSCRQVACATLRCEPADQAARAHHVHQQEMHAREDIVIVLRPHVLQLAEIVEGDGDLAAPHFVKLKCRR